MMQIAKLSSFSKDTGNDSSINCRSIASRLLLCTVSSIYDLHAEDLKLPLQFFQQFFAAQLCHQHATLTQLALERGLFDLDPKAN